jgi:hypothetical protein
MSHVRSGIAWMLTAPLALAGSQLAHELGYAAAAADPAERHHMLEASGHAYLDRYGPVAAALAAVLVAAGLFVHFRLARRGGRGARVGAAPFAFVPVTVFVLQEHCERLFHHGQVSLTAVATPTFVFGLALQLPFALVAYALARILLRAAEALARSLGGRRLVVIARLPARPRPPRSISLPRRAPLACGYTGRGPPLPA